jgi:nucleoside-diphosphate-sugar epimerase
VLTPFDELVGLFRTFFPGFSYEVLPGRKGHDRDNVLDISAARAQLGWKPAYDMKSALADYIDEVRTHGRA